jgi:subtilase family serine protease
MSMSLADWSDAVRRRAVEVILARATRGAGGTAHGRGERTGQSPFENRDRDTGIPPVREFRKAFERLFFSPPDTKHFQHGRDSRLTRKASRTGHGRRHMAEMLEPRQMLTVAPAVIPVAIPPVSVLGPVSISGNTPLAITPAATAPFRPSDITGAYGINSISFNGTAGNGAGQTIAIIDAYNDPNIISDAAAFNAQFGLPLFNTTGNATFQVLNQSGQSSPLPSNASSSTGGWDIEEALDVEWAHSVAPKANIILFEANSASDSDLYAAVQTAAASSGVSVVSMSFGSSEFSFEHNYDSIFTTPAGHQGVTFLASTGDSNAPAEYPAYSPNVVAVGGTSLAINANGSYGSESAWGNVNTGSGGGGGISSYETQPSFQTGNVNGLSSTKRTAPDVSMLADPNTGVYIYSTWAEGANNGSYYIAGGTSLACPMWAGLVAIANQGRALNGLATLDGPSQTLPRLYQLPSSVFHDVTSGNNGFAAGTGYDLATGIGTPIANLLVPQLAGVNNPASKLGFSVQPTNTTAGATIGSISVQVQDAFGNSIGTDTSSVTLAFTSNAGGATLSGTTTVAAVNGVATFTGLSINKAASYTFTATDGSLSSALSSSFTIDAGAASQVVFTRQPSNTTIEVAISPTVTASVEDALGNVATGNSSTITLTLSSGAFSTGSTTISAAAASGVASFSNIVINNAGSYTITASDGALSSAIGGSFTVAKATPTVSVIDSGGTYNSVALGATSASAIDPISSATIASFGNGLLSYAYYAGTLTALQIAGATPLGGAPSTAGAYTIVATYAGSANYNSASSSPVNFSIAQRVLHVTATGQSKVYDGSTTATVTLSDDRVGGDSFSIGDTSATFASKNAGSAIVISVAGLSISGGASGNYSLSSTSATTSANITALALTGSVTANSKVYDGTNAATLASRSLTGVVGADSVSLTGGAATFNSKDVTAATTVTVTGLTLSGAQAGNYTLGNPSESASAIITPLTISGSITASSKNYDGTTAAVVASRSLTGVLGSDSVSLTGGSASFNSKDVLAATTVTVTGLTLTGAQAGDYALSNPTETASAVITPLPLAATITAANKTYDGTTAATLNSTTLAGVIGADDVSLTGGGAAFSAKDAGNGKTVMLSGALLSGAQASDYSLANPSPTTTASISPLSITGSIAATNKVYDATNHATITSLMLSGVIGADQVTLIGGAATFDTQDAGNGKTVTDSGLTLSGAQAADYSLSNPTETTTANVTPLSITGSMTAAGKTYDGTNGATIISRTLTGVLGADTVTLTGGAATFNSKDVTTATTVTVTGLTLTGAQAADYALSNPTETASAGISPLSITLTIAASDKTYDGSAAATLTSATLAGIIGADNVMLAGGAATFDSKDVGNSKTVTLAGISLSGTQASDYSLSNPTPATTASVTPLSIGGSITAANRAYDGTTHVTITGMTLSGVIGADHVTLTGGTASFDTSDAGNGKTVTDSGLSLTGAQAGDYVLSNATETTTASVTPLTVTGSVTIANKTYDGTVAATISSRTLSGVLGLDDVSLTGGSAHFNSKDVPSATTAVITGLSLTGAQVGDYVLGNPTETASAGISPLSVTVTIAAADKTYNGSAAATLNSETLTGIVGADSVTLTGGAAAFATKDAGSSKVVTLNGVALGGAQSADYALANPAPTTTANITPLSITGSVTSANKVYDGATNATIATRTLTGVIGADAVTLTGGTANFNSKDVSAATMVTVTGLTLAGAQAGDYVLSNPSETAAASITPASLTITITAANKTYDGATAATLASETLAGVIGADDASVTGGTAAFATKDAAIDKTVTLNGVTLVGAQAGDYVLSNSTPTTTANVTPLAITGNITAVGKIYDGTNHATITNLTLTGVLGGDQVTLVNGTATFDTKEAGNGKTVTDSGLTLSGAQAADYSLSNPTETATANVTPLAIAANVTLAARTYDGTTTATIAGKSLAGVLSLDNVSLTGGMATFNSKDVNTANTVTVSGLTLSGAQAGDYMLSNPTPTISAAISPLAITLTITAANKTYDGSAAATLSSETLAGVIDGDDVSFGGGTAAFVTKDAGVGKTVTLTGVTLAGAQAADYVLANSSPTATADITPLALTGSITASNKIYDGTDHATIASLALSGVLGADHVTLTNGTATFDTKDVGAGKPVTDSGLTLSGAQAADYTLSNPTETATANVTPASISANVVIAAKTYDGSATATIASKELTGVFGLDDVSLAGGTASFNSKDVSAANTVTVTGLTISGAQAADYVLSNPEPTISAGIAPLGITLTIAAADKTYDGSAAATLTSESLSAIIDGDDVSLSGGTATFATKDAGDGKTVTLNGVTLIGAQAADYALADPTPTTTANVTPLAITGSITAANKIYDGTNRATIATPSLSGVIGADHVTLVNGTATFDTKDVGDEKSVTDLGLALSGAQAGDYTLANPNETAVANITPLAINATVTTASKIYDGTTNAAITSESVTGVLGVDDVTLVGGAASFSSKDVGLRTVTITGLSLTGAQAGDYMLANATPTTTAGITPLSISGQITAASKPYDGSAAANIAGRTLSEVLGNDNVVLSGGSATFATKNVGTGKTVTATGLGLGGAQAGDYVLANPTETAAADIAALPISGSISASNKVYDSTTATTLASTFLTGVVNGDAVTLAGGSAAFNSPDVGTAATVTATGLFLSGADAGNYLLLNPTESAPATITPRAVSGSIAANNKVFDGTTAATLGTMNLSGVLAGDNVALAGGAAFNSAAIGNNKLVTAGGLTLAGAKAGDYTLINPVETATASITPLTISGTVVSDTNANGTRQAGEAGLAGRVVTLQIAGQGTRGQKTTKTDANGNFAFTGIAAGNYVLTVATPAGWRATTRNTASLALHAGANIDGLFFGQTNTASVSGSVFADANANRKREGTEAGLAGWTVVLTTTGANPRQFTAVTDAAGAYVFSAVPAGAYHLSVVQMSGYSTTTKAPHYFAVSLAPAKAVAGELFGEQLVAAAKAKLRVGQRLTEKP